MIVWNQCHLCNCIQLYSIYFATSRFQAPRTNSTNLNWCPGFDWFWPLDSWKEAQDLWVSMSLYVCVFLSKLFGCAGREDGIMNWRLANCNELWIMNEICCSWQLDKSRLPLTVGRVEPEDLRMIPTGDRNPMRWWQQWTWRHCHRLLWWSLETIENTELHVFREKSSSSLIFSESLWMAIGLIGPSVRFQVQMSVHDFDDVVCSTWKLRT